MVSENEDYHNNPEPSFHKDDLEWTDWEEDSESVFLVNGNFVDRKNTPLPWLQPWVLEVAGWDEHDKSIWITYKKSLGYVDYYADPRLSSYRNSPSDQKVLIGIKIESPLLEKGKNKADLSKVSGKIESHFHPGLKTF